MIDLNLFFNMISKFVIIKFVKHIVILLNHLQKFSHRCVEGMFMIFHKEMY